MLQHIRTALWLALSSLVSPWRCAACDQALNRRALLCPGCAESVERWTGTDPPFAFGVYGGALASAILRLKYGSRPDLAGPLGLLLQQTFRVHQSELGPADLIVPVPVPPSRLQQRGYNQAALLARALLPITQAHFAPRALGRSEGQKQAALGREARLVNLHGAFRVRRVDQIAKKRVLLVDDVSTTGATLQACRGILLQSGAASVSALVLARAVRTISG